MKSALMLGVNPNAEREENDFYATCPSAIITVLDKFKEIGISKNIWECACGKGHISEVLKENGYNVYSTDLIDRGYADKQEDFLTTQNHFDGDIVTNPPFKLAKEFVEKAFTLIDDGSKVALFLKVQFLESKERKKLFMEYPLKHLIVYSQRQLCAKNAEFEKYTSTTQCYCWFVFEKGYGGKPTIDWV